MKTWVLRIRKEDKNIFEQIRLGEKSVETRAINPKKNFQAKDKVIFICSGDKIEKTILSVRKYNDFEKYLNSEDLEKVFGKGITKEKAKKIHLSFPGYKERLEKYGIVALDLR